MCISRSDYRFKLKSCLSLTILKGITFCAIITFLESLCPNVLLLCSVVLKVDGGAIMLKFMLAYNIIIVPWPNGGSHAQLPGMCLLCNLNFVQSSQESIINYAIARAYRPQRGRGHVTGTWKNSNPQAKIIKSTLSVHNTNAIQTAAVTIISYKPLSDLNFVTYTQHYGSYMPSPPLGSISPW